MIDRQLYTYMFPSKHLKMMNGTQLGNVKLKGEGNCRKTG